MDEQRYSATGAVHPMPNVGAGVTRTSDRSYRRRRLQITKDDSLVLARACSFPLRMLRLPDGFAFPLVAMKDVVSLQLVYTFKAETICRRTEER
jgi:hypothetical protein